MQNINKLHFLFLKVILLLFLATGIGIGAGGLGCGGEAFFSGEDGIFNPCTFGQDETCPQNGAFAQICVQGQFGGTECINVCNNATVQGPSNEGLGDFCETDDQCKSIPEEGLFLTCDNDVLGGNSSCRCVTTNEPNPEEPGDCPQVDVAPGSVPFDGACDEQSDCAPFEPGGQALPCIDCRCI